MANDIQLNVTKYLLQSFSTKVPWRVPEVARDSLSNGQFLLLR